MSPGGNRDFDFSKFQELVLYIALLSERSEWYGRTKLVKLLFYSDFEAFRRLGRSITGSTYRKLPYGPAPTELPTAIRELKNTNAAAERQVSRFGPQYRQTKLLAIREPNLAAFSGEEIAIVDEMLSEHADRTATELSDLTHKSAGWRLAEFGEVIPYETVLIPDKQRALTTKEKEWARAALDHLLVK